jgi:hypothetical protein
VFDYATDPTRFTRWQKGVVDGHLDSDGTPAVGDRCMTTRHIGFTDRETTSEVTVFDPPRRWRVCGLDGPIRATVEVTVEPRSDRQSTVAIAVDFEGHGIGRLLVPLMVRRQAEQEMPSNLIALKAVLEGSDPSSA